MEQNQQGGQGWQNGQQSGAAGRSPAPDQGRQLQQELEAQIRAFGASVSDGFRYGFEGRGQEIGDRAKGMGQSVWNAVNYGISQGQSAVQQSWNAPQNQPYVQPQTNAGAPYAQPNAAGWWRPRKSVLRSAANTRFGVGLAQTIIGGVLLFGLGLGGVICTALGFLDATVLATGLSLLVACIPFVWLTVCGAQNLSASSRLKSYDMAAGMQEAIPLSQLASLSQRSEEDTARELKKMIRRSWITAWFDEDGRVLYLSQGAYLQAQQEKQAAAAAQAGAETTDADRSAEKNAVLSSMENFIAVLGHEAQTMGDDPQAVAELQQMQKTSTAILGWLRVHPESTPKARRLASYYIPTTLKLLHTYNDVKAQGGDNAASIRRDISGMLHTLNTAFGNLHDTLLSDTALDVSSEIAALQGMLARDGLSDDIMNAKPTNG